MKNSFALQGLAAFGKLLSPGGARGCLSTLIYHRVLPEPDELHPGEVDAQSFDWQMLLLAQHCNVLSLEEAVQRLLTDSLPPRAVCITFDDGYADNAIVALPILLRYGLTATFFISTGYLDGGRMWNDTIIEAVRRAPNGDLNLAEEGFGVLSLSNPKERISAFQRLIDEIKYRPADERTETTTAIANRVSVALPDNLMMSRGQVRELYASGMAIGAHTVSHPILANSSAQVARDEIDSGRMELQEIIGAPVKLFAYPNGKPGRDYLPEHVDIVKKLGFSAAVSTTWGVATSTTDRWQIPRFTPWDRSPVKFMARLFGNCYRRI